MHCQKIGLTDTVATQVLTDKLTGPLDTYGMRKLHSTASQCIRLDLPSVQVLTSFNLSALIGYTHKIPDQRKTFEAGKPPSRFPPIVIKSHQDDILVTPE